MGADGINMGTRFLATKEAPVHDGVKPAIVDMTENDTALIFRSYKNTARVYKNDIALQVQDAKKRGGDFSEIHELVSGITRKRHGLPVK